MDLALKYYETYDFQMVYKSIEEIVMLGNKNLSETKYWNLAKSSDDAVKLENILYTALETFRLASVLMYPLSPIQTSKNLKYLGYESLKDPAIKKDNTYNLDIEGIEELYLKKVEPKIQEW